jgi:hypothetical protein
MKPSPFRPGESGEVSVLPRPSEKIAAKNTFLKHENPIAPVAEDDWSVLQ